MNMVTSSLLDLSTTCTGYVNRLLAMLVKNTLAARHAPSMRRYFAGTGSGWWWPPDSAPTPSMLNGPVCSCCGAAVRALD